MKAKCYFRNLNHYKLIFSVLGSGKRIPESQEIKWKKKRIVK